MKLIFSIFTLFYISEIVFSIQKFGGGDEIDITEAPYMVHIVYFKDTGAIYCGGSILRKNLILTAGHCE
jgi:secreted trypsin-like serine protease